MVGHACQMHKVIDLFVCQWRTLYLIMTFNNYWLMHSLLSISYDAKKNCPAKNVFSKANILIWLLLLRIYTLSASNVVFWQLLFPLLYYSWVSWPSLNWLVSIPVISGHGHGPHADLCVLVASCWILEFTWSTSHRAAFYWLVLHLYIITLSRNQTIIYTLSASKLSFLTSIVGIVTPMKEGFTAMARYWVCI